MNREVSESKMYLSNIIIFRNAKERKMIKFIEV